MSAPHIPLRTASGVLHLGGRPWLMGIVNATPDSFSDSGLNQTLEARVGLARELIEAGARIIDIGGESGVTNRPAVSADEEISRVVPVIERVSGELGAIVSVDTYKPAVAEAAIAAGASIVNDVSGLRDPALADLCAETGAALVLMHTRAAPKQKLLDPGLDGRAAADVDELLRERIAVATGRGVAFEQLLLDPGPDFGKTPSQTVEVLRELDRLQRFGRPLLLAVSRKDFIGAITGRPPRERLAGTLAAIAHGVRAGVHVLRVHDVAAVADFLAVDAVLGGEVEIDPGLRLADRVRWQQGSESGEDQPPPTARLASDRQARFKSTSIADRWPNAIGARRYRHEEDSAMSVLDRAALEESPLADLHALASELSIDGYRRLRRGDLIDAILARQGGGVPAPESEDERGEATPDREAAVVEEADREPAGEAATLEDAAVEEAAVSEAAIEEAEEADEDEDEDEKPSGRRRRGRRGGRGRSGRGDGPATVEQEPEEIEEPEPEPGPEEETIEGVVELLANGSGFLRVSPPDPSDDDVYISGAQVKRCELVSGDRVAGPRRAPRRSERFASLVRIDTINGRPAAELISGVRFEDLPAAFAEERLALDSLDPTLKAIDAQTPFGKGSRVIIVGGPRAGKTEALRRLASTLGSREDIQVSIALAGVRPEEITQWRAGPVEPAAALSFAASSDAQDHAVELVIDQARRIAARGAHALVLIDTLDGMHPHAARKALASARNIVDGGSLTVIATASEPLGGETTVIALDARLAAVGQFPALDVVASGTLRPELLVGEDGAHAILAARRGGVGR